MSGCSRLVHDSFPAAAIFLDMSTRDEERFYDAVDFTANAQSMSPETSPVRSKLGTIFVLPNGTTRDNTLETCVYTALTLSQKTDDDKLNHWFLLTSSAREQYWLKRNKILLNILNNPPQIDDSHDLRLPPPPPCVSVVTFERLGVLGWFGNKKQDSRKQEINSKEGILAIDEAHLLVPYLRTQPKLAKSLFQHFGRIFHFTYNIKLCDLGYLLQTFDAKEGTKEEHQYIDDFPTGDDEQFQTKYVKREGFHTVVQMTKYINGKLFDFAVTAAILVNIARIPGMISLANKWADTFSVQSISSTSLKKKWLSKYSWSTQKSVPSFDQPTDQSDEDKYQQLVQWRRRYNANRRGHKSVKTKWFGGNAWVRSQRKRKDVDARTYRRCRKRITHRHRGGFLVNTATAVTGGATLLVCLTLLSWVDSIRPGTAEGLGGEMWNLLGKITSGFFINMGKSIGSITKQLSPYVGTVSKSIIQFSRYIISHFPKSPSQFQGLRSVIHNGLQFINGTLYHLPVRHRGLTLLFVAFVSALHVAREVQMVVYPPRQYDGDTLFPKTNGNEKTLANFVYVANEHIPLVHHDTTIRSRIRRIVKHNSTHSPHRIKLVHYTLTNTQCEEAIQWSLRCRRNTDNKHLHKGLLISNNAENSTKWKRLTQVLEASKNVDGILFTHDSELKQYWITSSSYNIRPWSLSGGKQLSQSSASEEPPVLSTEAEPSEEGAQQNRTLWIINEDSLYDHKLSDRTRLLQQVGHIHFFEPTDYSLKQMVYSLCEHAKPYTKFNHLLPELNFGKTKYSIGYESKVQLQIYEYVSRFPHWTSSILSIFPNKQKKTVKQVVDEQELYTPDQIALAQYTTIQDDVQQLQEIYSHKFPSHKFPRDGSTLSTVLNKWIQEGQTPKLADLRTADFKIALKNAQTHYNECILGELKDVKGLSVEEKLEQALINAENEKQKMLIGRLRTAMQDMFKHTNIRLNMGNKSDS